MYIIWPGSLKIFRAISFDISGRAAVLKPGTINGSMILLPVFASIVEFGMCSRTIVGRPLMYWILTMSFGKKSYTRLFHILQQA